MVREKVSVESGNRRITIEPADAYEIDCMIDFPHPLIGMQQRSLVLDNGAFGRDIASARTFGFIEEVEALRRANLIRGGSLEMPLLTVMNAESYGPGSLMNLSVTKSGHHWRLYCSGCVTAGRATKRSPAARGADVRAAQKPRRLGNCGPAGQRTAGRRTIPNLTRAACIPQVKSQAGTPEPPHFC
jgi:hypothetical protein